MTSSQTLWRRLAAGIGVALSAFLWWSYVQATNPGVTLQQLMWQANVDAGGGVVPTVVYLKFLGLAFAASFLFVWAGYAICARTGAFSIQGFAARDTGLFYFIGVAAYLVLFATLTMATGRARASWLAIMLVFLAAAVHGVYSQRIGARLVAWLRAHGLTLLALSPVAVAVLCLLQYVVTKRGGPMYEEFARYIVANNYIPLINRHFGQSMQASALMFVTGTGPDTITYPRAAVNVWLYVTQIGFMLLVFRMLLELGASRAGSVFGMIYLMLGNAALSLLPRIPYDHDYPVIMNVYADSVFGLAGFLIVTWFLMALVWRESAPSRARWPALAVPAVFVMAFNYTAELNMAMVLGTVAMLCAVVPLRRVFGFHVPFKPLAAMLLVCSLAAVAGAIQGGVLSSRFAGAEGRKSPFFEQEASSSKMTVTDVRWWYLPEVLPGFLTGFGNMSLPQFYLADQKLSRIDQIQWTILQSMNQPLLDQFFADTTGSAFRYIHPIYLAEMRLFQVLRLLWFPIVGLSSLGILLRFAPRLTARMFAANEDALARLRLFWLIGAATFGVGLVVVFFTNATDGNALFWKWALTRAFEPGLLLTMLAFALVMDGVLRMMPSRGWRYAVWFGLAVVMSFGTLFRILAYPSFNG